MKKRGTKSASGPEGSEPARRDSIVEYLSEANFDPVQSKLFADRIRIAARSFKRATLPNVDMTSVLNDIEKSFRAAAKAITASRKTEVMFDPDLYITAYANQQPKKLPSFDEMRESLIAYADIAKRISASVPQLKRGEKDGSKYVPVQICAGLWSDVFGTEPTAEAASPFVQVCRLALPDFNVEPAEKLHEHIARALRARNI